LFYASIVCEIEVKLSRWLLNFRVSRELVGNFKELFYLKASQQQLERTEQIMDKITFKCNYKCRLWIFNDTSK